MTDEDQRLAEMLRMAAARAERDAPVFEPDRIVATAHRRRPWLYVASLFRRARVTTAPAFALATVAVLVAALVVGLTAAHVFSGGGHRFAGPTTTTVLRVPTTPLVSTTRPPPPSSTTAPPRSTTTAPGTTTTTIPATTTTGASTTTTTLPTTTTTFFYTARWQGNTVDLQPVTYIPDMHARNAALVGQVTDFLTDDPNFVSLDGGSLDVWRVPGAAGELFVDNSEQPQTAKGTWVFPT
jgi:hypothetical protein